jgi:hypothetical protein
MIDPIGDSGMADYLCAPWFYLPTVKKLTIAPPDIASEPQNWL